MSWPSVKTDKGQMSNQAKGERDAEKKDKVRRRAGQETSQRNNIPGVELAGSPHLSPPVPSGTEF